MLGVEWENLNLAAAFVLGAALGSLATIRVMRAVMQTYDRQARTRDDGRRQKGGDP